MDPKVENKCDFDEAAIQVNAMLRAMREFCVENQIQQPLCSFAHSVAKLMEKTDIPMPSFTKAIRQYARLINIVADEVAECERSHPGRRCAVGGLILHQLVLPTMLGISCVSAGFELARGKDMKLEDSDA